MNYRLLVCLLLWAHAGIAQELRGKLFGESVKGKEILPGGTIRSIQTGISVQANENGVFVLALDSTGDRRIVAEEPGYLTDTLDPGALTYLSVVLKPNGNSLKTITVTDTRGAHLTQAIGHTEVINPRELAKAACCDLAGCFGTQASVQAQTTNIVTNAQELRILGLSGVYNQLLVDGLPMIQGLAYTYGVSTYPGTLVGNIYVSKGTSSVLQGFESISGQINLETQSPKTAAPLYLNAYINSFGEKHLNAQLATAVGRAKKWHTLLATHTVQPAAKTDGNGDGFLDLPKLTRYMVFNKWQYGNEQTPGFHTQFGWRAVRESRVGGQLAYDATNDRGSHTIYGQSVQFDQGEFFSKSGFRFSRQHLIALSVAGWIQSQHSWMGITSYRARQQWLYLNLQHEWQWERRHSLKYGVSYRYQQLREQIRFSDNSLGRSFAGDYLTPLRVPGLFAEQTFRWRDDRFSWIIGARVDRHQSGNVFLTPRSMLKWMMGRHYTLRISAGSGWRQVNLFSEQINLLTGSRDIVFADVLKPERAINLGFSHAYTVDFGPRWSASLVVDAYHTRFQNQFFPDYDAGPTRVIIRNFEGISRSNGAQVEAALRYHKQWEWKAGYNYLDVYRVEQNQKTRLPFNPRNRIMSAISWRSKEERWQVDMNLHWFDKMRLPNTAMNPPEYRRLPYSQAYATLNMQLSFYWSTLNLYAGCENIANYRQPNPIISAHNPFGPYFDLSSVWGPTRGREWYIGVKYRLK